MIFKFSTSWEVWYKNAWIYEKEGKREKRHFERRWKMAGIVNNRY